MKQSKRSILVVLSILLAAVLAAHEAVAQSAKRVLVLYSYSRLVPVDVEVDHGLDTVFEPEGMGSIRRSSEFLDSPEFQGDAYEDLMAVYLGGKYADSPPDVIIAVADNALSFLVHHRTRLFPGIPIVHTVVSSSSLQALGPIPADIVGVANDYDFIGTVNQAIVWHPSARRLVIITGASL